MTGSIENGNNSPDVEYWQVNDCHASAGNGYPCREMVVADRLLVTEHERVGGWPLEENQANGQIG